MIPRHEKAFHALMLMMLSLLLLTSGGCSDDDDNGTAPPVDSDAPADVTSFLVLPGDGQAFLTWTNPADTDLAGVMIRRAVGIDPTLTTGENVFEGLATQFTDNDVVNNTTYHYTAFAFDQEGNHADGVSGSCTPREASAVVIADEQLEQLLRSELGVPAGDITDLDMVGLTTLDAGNQGIANLQGLEHAVNLATLDLGGNDLTNDSNLAVLAALSSLTSLSLSGNEITILPDLSALTGLLTLDVIDNPLASLSPLSGVTSLEALTFGLCPVSDLTPLAGLVSLDRLRFQEADVTSLAPLSGLTSLTALEVISSPVGSAEVVASLPNLTQLLLIHTSIDDLSPLSVLTGLRVLGLTGNGLDDVADLAGLTNLTHLELDNNDLTTIAPLAPLVGLTSLALSGNQVRDISALDGMTALEWFLASDNLITDIEVLTGLPALRNVGLRNNPLGADAINNALPTLVADGVDVDFDHDAALLDLMGAWMISTVTVDGIAVDLADFLDWDPGTVTMRLTVFPFGAYMIEELDAADVPVYVETGFIEVDGADLAVIAHTEDGVSVDPPQEVFSGTWDLSGDDLQFSTQQGEDLVVLTWTPLLF